MMTVLPQRYDPVEALHANIRDALAELRGARAVHEHAPDAESLRTVELCEYRLDVLLSRQAQLGKTET